MFHVFCAKIVRAGWKIVKSLGFTRFYQILQLDLDSIITSIYFFSNFWTNIHSTLTLCFNWVKSAKWARIQPGPLNWLSEPCTLWRLPFILYLIWPWELQDSITRGKKIILEGVQFWISNICCYFKDLISRIYKEVEWKKCALIIV